MKMRFIPPLKQSGDLFKGMRRGGKRARYRGLERSVKRPRNLGESALPCGFDDWSPRVRRLHRLRGFSRSRG